MPRRASLSIALLCASTLPCSPVKGLLPSGGIRAFARVNHPSRAAANDNDGSDGSHRWKHEPFDFSSKFGWDNFYKNGLAHSDEAAAIFTKDGQIDPAVESLEYEWHSTIPHAAIVDAVRPAVAAASKHHSQQSTPSAQGRLPSILLVGCGNSALPRVLHDAFDVPVQVTCLDYSPVCIDMIRSMYASTCPNMEFVVGDATRLQDVIWDEDPRNQSTEEKRFDVIVDKGLLDALMCGEGFDMEQLVGGINKVLTPEEWGMHVLICFELSKASKQSLVEMGSDMVWDFDIPVEGTERGRARFNLARRSARQSKGAVGIESMTTEWI